MSASWRWQGKLTTWIASGWRGFFLVPLLVGFCALSAHMLVQLRHDAFRNTIQGANNLLAAVSQDVVRNIELYDLSLQAVCSGVVNENVVALPPALRQDALFDHAATARYFGAIEVLDSRGTPVFSSAGPLPEGRTLAAQSDFLHHRDHPGDGLLVGGPDRLPDGTLALTLSRRISRADGSFAGIAIGTLSLDYFRDLFGRLRLSRDSAISLFREDGVLLARTPWNDAIIGRSIRASSTFRQLSARPDGLLTATSAIDGVRRTYSFSRLDGLPLILDVATSEHDIYATWKRQATVIGVAVAVLSLAGLLLSLLFNRELRRRAGAERLIRRSEEQYRLLADNCTDLIMRMDRDLVRTFVSPASRTLLGRAPEEMLGGRNRDILHADDVNDLLGRLHEAQRSGQPAEATYRLRRKDGDYVWVEGRYSFVPEDGGFILVLRDISRRKAAELELGRANAELARLATMDGLTGLANRRCFDERLDQEWRRAMREGTPLSLILLDVDHFKRFNDHYGHPAGDACLKAVAGAVAGSVRRPGDFAARYGGEEFAVLLPGTDGSGVASLAERLRYAVESLAIPHEGNGGRGVVTISIGIVTMVPAMQDPSDSARLVERADVALYGAKRGGRNRVTVGSAAPAAVTTQLASDGAGHTPAPAACKSSGTIQAPSRLDAIACPAMRLPDEPGPFADRLHARA